LKQNYQQQKNTRPAFRSNAASHASNANASGSITAAIGANFQAFPLRWFKKLFIVSFAY